MGEVLTSGMLLDAGVKPTRKRVREAQARLDADGVDDRKSTAVARRVYSVPHAHYLWHLDGNMKMLRFRLAVHGMIDGFSHAIVMLKCDDNNRAATVLNHFYEAVRKYGFPLHVRCDKGTENVLVADAQLVARGEGAVFTGSSVHNQRIERLWRDVKITPLNEFIELFTWMEDFGVDFKDNDMCYVLHVLFLPLINRELEIFVGGWNNHKMNSRTMKGGKSPNMVLALNHHSNPAPPNMSAVEEQVLVELGITGDDEELVQNSERMRLEPIAWRHDPQLRARFLEAVQPLPFGIHTCSQQECHDILMPL